MWGFGGRKWEKINGGKNLSLCGEKLYKLAVLKLYKFAVLEYVGGENINGGRENSTPTYLPNPCVYLTLRNARDKTAM